MTTNWVRFIFRGQLICTAVCTILIFKKKTEAFKMIEKKKLNSSYFRTMYFRFVQLFVLSVLICRTLCNGEHNAFCAHTSFTHYLYVSLHLCPSYKRSMLRVVITAYNKIYPTHHVLKKTMIRQLSPYILAINAVLCCHILSLFTFFFHAHTNIFAY